MKPASVAANGGTIDQTPSSRPLVCLHERESDEGGRERNESENMERSDGRWREGGRGGIYNPDLLPHRPTDRLSSFDDSSCESCDLANRFCDWTAAAAAAGRVSEGCDAAILSPANMRAAG